MESIKLSLFDIFAYTLPGLFILIGIIILADDSITTLTHFTKVFNGIGIGTGIVAILTAYVIGFAIDSPASYYYNISCKFGKNPKEDNRKKFSLDKEEQLQLHQIVREKCPNITGLLQTWKLLKTMSHNLAFTFLLLTIFLLVKSIFYSVSNLSQWYLLSAGCMILSLILTKRAKVFDWWFYQDLFNTGLALKLPFSDNMTKEERVLHPNEGKKYKSGKTEKK